MTPSETQPGPGASRALGAAAAHLRRYFRLMQAAEAAADRQYPPEDLYLISRSDEFLVELIGFRVRGHPAAMIGAVRFPRHKGSTVPDGRPSLPQFLTSPQQAVPPQGGGMPADLLKVYLPRQDESIPDFMARLASGTSGQPVYVDPALVDVAFDFRFHNPSALGHFTPRGQTSEEAVLRTIHGHVIVATVHGLRRTLHADTGFFAVTRARQLVPDGEIPMPTLALNRDFAALVMATDGSDPGSAFDNLAVAPSMASRYSLLGFSTTD